MQKPGPRKRSRLTLNQSANLKAYAVRRSMAYGYAITVWHTGAQEPVTGKVVRFSIVPEAMKLGGNEGGSPLVMQFDNGATVALERVNRIERAGT